MNHCHPSIAIIGSGVAGLAAANRLHRQRPEIEITVFEASPTVGGVLQTDHIDGFLIERSADMFVRRPDSAINFCEEIGFSDQLIPLNENHRFSCIALRGTLTRVPQGFSLMQPNRIWPVLTTPLLSWTGKLRFLREWFVPVAACLKDESLETFAVRHFGREVFERMIQPLVAGIYSADANRLSIQATLKRFQDLEVKYGSLIRAARHENRKQALEQQSSGARYGLFVAPRDGMGSLVKAVQNRLAPNTIQTNRPIKSIERSNARWAIIGHDASRQEFDGVIVTTRAKGAAPMLDGVHRDLSSPLMEFEYGSMAIVVIACSESSFTTGPPQGFGFVVPEIENRNLIACSFSSNKLPGRAPAGKCLLRCFVGGGHRAHLLEHSDRELETMMEAELSELLGYQRQRTDFMQVVRWEQCMPQYHVGHLDRITQMERALEGLPGLELAGCSYLGVGIGACIDSGQAAATRLADSLLCASETATENHSDA